MTSEPTRLGNFSVGSSAQFEHVITLEDIRKFVDITGDDNPLHVDPSFAERTSFKTPVVHGMLSASFFSTLIGKHIPGNGALWMSQSLEFLLPVRVGDRLKIFAEVIGIQVSQRILQIKTEIRNQHDQVVVRGEAKVKALEVTEPSKVTKSEAAEARVAIVTGASRGIGAEIALHLAKAGFAVIVNYKSDAKSAARIVAQIESAGGRAIGVEADISKPKGAKALVQTAVSRFGSLSTIVNNASEKMVAKPFSELTPEDFSRHWDLQVMGTFHLIQEALPFLEKSSNASVVNLGTINIDNVPAAQTTAYTAAKAAMAAMTRSLAVEFGPKGIRFNLVSPGMTETAMIADLPEKAKMLTKMQTPLRRLAQPSEIAEGVVFLASPVARHITGETLRICGGIVML